MRPRFPLALAGGFHSLHPLKRASRISLLILYASSDEDICAGSKLASANLASDCRIPWSRTLLMQPGGKPNSLDFIQSFSFKDFGNFEKN